MQILRALLVQQMVLKIFYAFIQLPESDYLNPKQSYLQFKAKIVDDGGLAGSQFRNGIGCLFQAVRVYVGGQL